MPLERVGNHLGFEPGGHLADDADALGCDSGSVGPCYEIAGYVDGDLTACSACRTSTNAAWEGDYPQRQGSDCFWYHLTADPFTDDPKIDGKLFATNSGVSRVAFRDENASNPCKWELLVGCVNEPGSGLSVIWRGFKLTGFDPTGTYTRDGGCDTTATLTVAAC